MFKRLFSHYILMAEYTKTRGSMLMCIRSRDLTNTPTNGYNSSGRFTLFEPIEARDNEVLSIKLISAIMPNSWYNLDSALGNNTLDITEKRLSDNNEINFTITIPNGSYNINELNTEIETALNSGSGYNITYELTYSEVQNADTITMDNTTLYNTTFRFADGNNLRRLIGFTDTNRIITTSTGIISDRAVDVTDTFNSIYVRLPNINSSKVIESYTKRFSNVVSQIPIEYSRNTLMLIEPQNPFEMEINNKSISSIFISITFQDELLEVNFGRADWELNLQVDFYRKPPDKKRPHILHNNIRRRLTQYTQQKNQDEQSINELKKLSLGK
jgi:hypothetical protein